MRLIDLCKGWLDVPARYREHEIRGLSCDSRVVDKGHLFVAIPGERTDGHLYAEQAVNAGAVAVLGDKRSREGMGVRDLGVPFLKVRDVRSALGELARAFYGDPAARLDLCAVTGTKGKTTTTWLLDGILNAAGKVTGLFGTVENRIAVDRFGASNTTAGCLDLHAWLKELTRKGGSHATIEVSSHAIHQHRTAGIDFDCAVFTNIAPEHLDYHRTFDNYLATKVRLFTGLRPGALAVLPRKEKASQMIAERTCADVVWYGHEAEDGVGDVQSTPDGIHFTWRGLPVQTNLWGYHNLQNALAAMTAAVCLGIDEQVIAQSMSRCKVPPGRLEEVHSAAPFRVVVDYAHTDGALEAVLEALRPITPGRLITIFGCGGDRDKTKRPRMGAAAEKGSDHVIITSDNPRSESPRAILEDIAAGLADANEAVFVEDRREAIGLGIRMARKGDTVLVAGKGHETYQEFADNTLHFDDREVAGEFLREILEGCLT